MNNEQKKEFNIATATEQMLDGMSHMLTKDDWDALLLARQQTEDPWDIKAGLSGAFLIKYRNKLNMSLLPSFIVYQAHNYPDLNIDLVKRFWRYMPMDAGKAAHFHGRGTAPYKDLYEERFFKHIDTSIPYEMGFDGKVTVTYKDLDKHPYKYDIGIWQNVMKNTKEVISEAFIDQYIHLIRFDDILINPNLPQKVKDQIIAKYSIKVGGTNGREEQQMFPCGALLHNNDITPGLEYYNSESRFGGWEDTNDILTIAKKFKRAMFDCEYPENKEAMKDK
jgi:hypothetical protein